MGGCSPTTGTLSWLKNPTNRRAPGPDARAPAAPIHREARRRKSKRPPKARPRKEQRDAFWLFRRQEPRICDHHAEDPVPLDQLPRVGALLRARLAPPRRLLLLSRRPPAAADALPLQQRPHRPGRATTLRPRR